MCAVSQDTTRVDLYRTGSSKHELNIFTCIKRHMTNITVGRTVHGASADVKPSNTEKCTSSSEIWQYSTITGMRALLKLNITHILSDVAFEALYLQKPSLRRSRQIVYTMSETSHGCRRQCVASVKIY